MTSAIVSSKAPPATGTSNRPSPEYITFRIGDKLVYVQPAETYEAAIKLALQEFPEELGGISPHRITFTKTALLNGEKIPVRISESVWTTVLKRLFSGEVVDVGIAPDDDREKIDCAPPPQYFEDSGSSGAVASRRETRISSSSAKDTRSRPRWLRFLS
ncbi:hypothetical protein L218DRAFT_1037234 [Marasmius fiardii PR-910]|nr:hypothetical protein L218DRAFT_1037234 [Marasmius fiardii PR-910]